MLRTLRRMEHERREDCSSDDPKLEVVTHLLRRRFGRDLDVLAVGCGDGTEAAILADSLGWTITGIDVVDQFHPSARGRVELVVADARELPFPNGSFDLVFSYHALEHIPQADRAIAEMRRVVRDDGALWVGTPNRSRLLGYLGSRDASARDKVVWNLTEWRERIQGRFRNELGAHAGFTTSELCELLAPEFRDVEDETGAYYELLYPRFQGALSVLRRLRLGGYVYPSIYLTGRVRDRQA